MAITNYTELKSAIADFLNRDDLTAVIPTFIALAESSINRNVRHWRMEKRVETTLNEQYENIPNDFLEALELSLDNDTRLTLVSVADMQDKKESNTDSGKPRFYRMTADQFEFYPAPDDAYTLSLQYIAKTPALSDSNTSNWLLEYSPDIYLYGSLLHSAPYLVDDQRIQVWASLYQSAIESLSVENARAKHSGPLKIGVPR